MESGWSDIPAHSRKNNRQELRQYLLNDASAIGSAENYGGNRSVYPENFQHIYEKQSGGVAYRKAIRGVHPPEEYDN